MGTLCLCSRQGLPGRGIPGHEGTYNNLLCAHRPFQIDGNMGGTAGIAEMLVQSHSGMVNLLPALPSAWPDGKVRGLRAREGFTIDMEWRDGALFHVTIHSEYGALLKLKYMDHFLEKKLQTRGIFVLYRGALIVLGFFNY